MSEPAGHRGFLDALAAGPLVADAALGTRLIAQGLDLAADDPALWNLTHPEAVAALHRRDRAAGAAALLTNTFGANRAWLARFDRASSVAEINRRAVALARSAAVAEGEAPAYVLGSIGPTAAAEPGAYEEQIEALAAAGADALWFETHRLPEALVALAAAERAPHLPRIVTLVAWPEPLEDAAHRLADAGAELIGGNCMIGMPAALELAKCLRDATNLPLVVKPSAALPGTPTESPESFARAVPSLLDCGVRLLGGCCGSEESHVAALARAVAAHDASLRIVESLAANSPRDSL